MFVHVCNVDLVMFAGLPVSLGCFITNSTEPRPAAR